MKKTGIASFIVVMMSSAAFAQSDIVGIKHNHDYRIEMTSDSLINEMFLNVNDTSIVKFPGLKEQSIKEQKFSRESFHYGDIGNGKVKRSRAGNILKGIAIGGAIGLTPAIISAIFGKGEGGAYVSVITFPLGLVTGGIIGATSKRKRK